MIDVRGWLGAERAGFVELLGGLDREQWGLGTECPGWAVKGIALHILGDDLSLLARQRDAATPGIFVFAEDHPGLGFRALLNGFNEQWVQAAQFFSHRLIVELLGLTGEWTEAFHAATDPAALGEPVGLFGRAGPSPYWQIAGREYVERWTHQHQVRRAVGAPDLGPELLVPAMDVVATALAARLPEDRRAVAVEFPGVGRWPLQPQVDATVTLDPEQAVTVLSRGLPAAGVLASLTRDGDPTVAEEASATLAQLTGRP